MVTSYTQVYQTYRGCSDQSYQVGRWFWENGVSRTAGETEAPYTSVSEAKGRHDRNIHISISTNTTLTSYRRRSVQGIDQAAHTSFNSSLEDLWTVRGVYTRTRFTAEWSTNGTPSPAMWLTLPP